MIRRVIPSFVLVSLLAAPALAAPSKNEIKKAFKSGQRDRVVAVLDTLKGQLDKGTLKAVLQNAKRLRTLGVYDKLVAVLRSVKGEALDELIKAYKKQKKGDMRFLIVDALGKVKGKAAEGVLVTALKKDKDEPVRVLSARLLGQRGTKSAVSSLIPILKSFEKDPKRQRLTREVNAALQNLTGSDITVAEDWKNYWDANKGKFTKKTSDDGKTSERGNLIDRMKKQRPADMKTISRVKKSELIVIKGNDKVEDVLKALDLKHKVIRRNEFDSLKLDPETQIVLLNCPGRDKFSDAGIQKIREFVARGGYLFCSDWELKKTLAKAFPEVVQFLKETPKGKNRQVTITPARGARSHPLMRDVFPLNTWDKRGFAWVLEQRSHLVKDNKALTKLVDCPDIKNLGSTLVAFVFGFTASKKRGVRPVTGASRRRGKREVRAGQVLFVSSHFKLQKDEKGDGFALQQLLLNFILEKQNQRKRFKGRKRK